ncbi:hypothetical protein CRUP_035427 [Coryphaenoides rupestris]|nr:hypothetical protein CRUP_035427 [Coryphaenoides rupestris]
MQELNNFSSTTKMVLMCLALLVLTQQVVSGPLPPIDPSSPGSDRGPGGALGVGVGVGVGPVLRRVARMTPLWRLMNSKPLGAYCQGNYECSTGLCRGGRCSSSHSSSSEPVKY